MIEILLNNALNIHIDNIYSIHVYTYPHMPILQCPPWAQHMSFRSLITHLVLRLYTCAFLANESSGIHINSLNTILHVVKPWSNCNYHIINWFFWIHYEALIFKRISDAGGAEPCIVENICPIRWSHSTQCLMISVSRILYKIWTP